jgi:membrane protein DedA with SNARE-associated domain
VIASAAGGTLVGDQIYFFLGRYKGKDVLGNRPHWQAQADRFFNLLERHETLVIIGYRYLYGMRIIGSFVIGMSRVNTTKYIGLDILGTLIWASIYAGLGYAFGKAFEAVVGDIQHYQAHIIGIIIVLGLSWYALMYYRRKRSAVAVASKTSEE